MKKERPVAFVTGGTKGIGAATAIRLTRAGFDIGITSRNPDDGGGRVKEQIENAGGRCLLIKADMGIREDCERSSTTVLDEYGSLDVLVHNAGGPEPGSLLDDETPETWLKAFDVHVHAAFYLARTVATSMIKQQRGSIILVSSVAGLRGLPNALPYTTVKGALHQLTRSLATELAEHNIRVNAVSPGIIRTRFHENMSAEQKKYNLEYRIPLRREGTPEEVAHVIEFLAENQYITGENIVIDGGLTMRIR